MNQKYSQKLAAEGYKLYTAELYRDAESKYVEAIEQADLSHWSTQDIYGEYSLVLRKLGKNNEALKMLEMSVESAIKADPNSNGVTIARHFLAEFLIELNEFERALKELLPILEFNVEQKWLLHYSAANAYFHIGDTINYDKEVSEVLRLGPGNRFPDEASVRNKIENNEKASS